MLLMLKQFHWLRIINNVSTLNNLNTCRNMRLPRLLCIKNRDILKCLRWRGFSATIRALNHYDTLGIKRDASESEIKQAYISLTKIHHPDTKSNVLKDTEQFLKVSEAYKVLSNASTRRQYDFKKFGMSSDLNRFESGEYEMPLYERKGKPHRAKTDSTVQESLKQTKNVMGLFMLSPEARRVLDYLLAALISIWLTMYFITRYQKKHSED